MLEEIGALLEIKGEIAGDEAARPGDDDQIILFQGRVFFYDAFLFLHKLILG